MTESYRMDAEGSPSSPAITQHTSKMKWKGLWLNKYLMLLFKVCKVSLLKTFSHLCFVFFRSLYISIFAGPAILFFFRCSIFYYHVTCMNNYFLMITSTVINFEFKMIRSTSCCCFVAFGLFVYSNQYGQYQVKVRNIRNKHSVGHVNTGWYSE